MIIWCFISMIEILVNFTITCFELSMECQANIALFGYISQSLVKILILSKIGGVINVANFLLQLILYGKTN
jgi:hypothetical protein